MEDLGLGGASDLEVNPSPAGDADDRESLRKALGFPERSVDANDPAPGRRRDPIGNGAAGGDREDVATREIAVQADPCQSTDLGPHPAWRGDLNQLYAAMSERLKVHSEDVTRQLADERERLAVLLRTMIEELGKLRWTPSPGADQASDVRLLESQLLAKVDEFTQKMASERDGLVQVVSAIEQELRDIRATPLGVPASPSDSSLALLKAQVAEIHAMLEDRRLTEAGGGGDPNALSDVLGKRIADIRAQLAEERAGRDAWLQSVAHRLALQLTELNGRPGATAQQDDSAVLSEVRALAVSVAAIVGPTSSGVSLDVVADDLDTMRKELDERLTTIEAALAHVRSSLRDG